jgi:hypothetical protein
LPPVLKPFLSAERDQTRLGEGAVKSPFKSLETKLIHAGEPEPRILGAVAMPIFQSATFQYAGETSYTT